MVVMENEIGDPRENDDPRPHGADLEAPLESITMDKMASTIKKRKREEVVTEEMEREGLQGPNANNRKKKKKKKKSAKNEKNEKRERRDDQSHRHENASANETTTTRERGSTSSRAGTDAGEDLGGPETAIDVGGQTPSPVNQSDEHMPALDPTSDQMDHDDDVRLRRGDRVLSVNSRDQTRIMRDRDNGRGNQAVIGRRRNAWNSSPMLGGRMIDADPVFTRDEKFLILAYPSAVAIYSIQASSLVRSLPVTASTSAEAETTAYALSATQPSHLYLANSRGILYLFDWVHGTKLGRWKLGTKIWDMTVSTHRSSSTTPDTVMDVVYTREQKGNRWWISAHRLRVEADAARTESKSILSSSSPITHYHVIDGGLMLIAVSGSRLMVGESVGDATASLKDLKYIWREVTMPAPINALDVRISTRPSPPTKGRSPSSSSSSSSSRKRIQCMNVDVLVGDSNGVIFVHQDLHASLVRSERQSNGSVDVRTSTRRMHWHREAVRSVKWSRDGNYVISGGAETVLVLWQLETDRCQFLPHLAAAIESIVVSPTGTAYAIRLSDNSTMVLSTAELNAKAYVAGIQAPTPCLRKNTSSARKTPDIGQAGVRDEQLLGIRAPMVPATISGLDPTRLLLAVPSTSSNDPVVVGGPFLQTVDLTTAHHVARQALTRTNVTNLNIGPENNKLVEPSVTLIRASSGDGRWLATVDEWSPPMKDMGPFSITDQGRRRECRRRTEIHLKFWSWDPESMHWQLASRVDGPHSLGSGETFVAATGRVLDLQADPSQLGFATLGDDYSVRVWKSKARRRPDGVMAVRDSNGRAMTEWYCQSVVPLRVVALDDASSPTRFDDDRVQDRSVTARLAYSSDGSVLVASQTGLDEDTSGLVYFIDVDTGTIRRTQSGLYRGGLVGLGLVEQYLVTLADQLKVWDVVQDRLCYGFSLLDLGVSLTREQKAAMTHLAVDQSNGTFAVALPVLDRRARKQRREAVKPLTGRVLQQGRSYVLVFDATKRRPSPLQWMESPRLVTALVPRRGSSTASVVSAYVVVDGAAQIQTITGPSSTVDLIRQPEEVATAAAAAANDDDMTMAMVDSPDENMKDIQQQHQYRFGEEEADEGGSPPPTVRQDQFAAIFDIGPAYSLPPVAELFHRVADLLSKRPITTLTTAVGYVE